MASYMELKSVSESLGGNEDVVLWKTVSNDLNMCDMIVGCLIHMLGPLYRESSHSRNYSHVGEVGF